MSASTAIGARAITIPTLIGTVLIGTAKGVSSGNSRNLNNIDDSNDPQQNQQTNSKQKVINKHTSGLHFIIKKDNVFALENFMDKHGINYQDFMSLYLQHKHMTWKLLIYCCMSSATKIIANFMRLANFHQLFVSTNVEIVDTLKQFMGNFDLFKKVFYVNKFDINTTNDCGSTLLHYASYLGNASELEFLLQCGANINCKNIHCYTPLITSMHNGATQNTMFLIDKGANLNITYEKGKSALMLALEYSQLDIAEKLIQAGADVNIVDKDDNTALSLSINIDAYRVIFPLLERGAKIHNWATISFRGILYGHGEKLQYWSKNQKLFIEDFTSICRDKCSDFAFACKINDEKTVKSLLGSVDVNYMGEDNVTPLCYVVKNKNEKLLKLVAESGGLFRKKHLCRDVALIDKKSLLKFARPYRDKLYVCRMKCRLMLCAGRFSGDSSVYEEKFPRDLLHLILKFLTISIYDDISALKNAK